MWTTIICGLIAFVISVIFFIDEQGLDEFGDWVFIFILSTLYSTLGAMVGLVLALMLPADIETKITTNNLECLQDNNSVSGSFFLGCGGIDGNMKYVYYYEDNGSYKMEQLYYKFVSIKYDENKPRVEKYEKIMSDTKWNEFAIDFFDNPTYIIYIPKGTIKQNYNLDAK